MTSIDRGVSIQVFPHVKGESQAYNAGRPSITTGASFSGYMIQSGINGAPSLDHEHPTRYSFPISPGLLGGGVPDTHVIYYKMQGWYAAGSVYENWVSTNAPNYTPPSGHSLSNIVIIGVLR